MNQQTVHKKIIGKIQLNTFAYEKKVFKIIVKRLIQSNTFHSVCTQTINHCPQNSNNKICNCDEILEYISKEFHQQTVRFSQLFVPIVIVDHYSKVHHFLICELLYIYDKLLKTRKEFYIDDIKEMALFKACKYKDNCVCKLREILSLDKGSNLSKNNEINKVNDTCLHEVMKELVSNKLLPLSSKSLPLDSFRLQKVLDICNKYYLPDQTTVSILNNLRSIKSDCNQSNNDTKSFNNKSFEYEESDLYNSNGFPLDSVKSDNSWKMPINNSVKNISVNKSSVQMNPNNEEINGSNVGIIRRTPYNEKSLRNNQTMENSHNRSYSSLRNTRNTQNGIELYGNTSMNSEVRPWKTLNERSYRPTTFRTSIQPQISDNYKNSQSERRSNFHWSNRGNFQSGNYPRGSISRRSNDYQRVSKTGESHYQNHKNSQEPYYKNDCCYDDKAEFDNSYEVVIDDEGHDLGNVETITVRDGDGNIRTYVDCDAITPAMCRPIEKARPCIPKKCNKKVTFVNNTDKNRDCTRRCDSNTLTKVVLCQEANSMDALMSVLNKQVEKDEVHQCMKLSVKAEHVIKLPECPGEKLANSDSDDYLKISSEVQAQWENLNCEDDSRTPSLPVEIIYDNDGYQLYSKNRSVGTSPKSASRVTNNMQSIYSRSTSPMNMPFLNLAHICDKAIQTEKFFFFESCNERILISPNSFDCPKYTPSSKVSVGMNTIQEPKKSSNRDVYSENQKGYDDSCGQFYFYEDRNKRIICSPNEFSFCHRETQTAEHYPHDTSPDHTQYISSYQTHSNKDYRPQSNFNEREKSHFSPTLGDFFRDPRQTFSDLNSKYNFNIANDPRFQHHSDMSPEQNDMMKNGSRMYSLKGFKNSAGTNSFANSLNDEQTSLSKQMNYSSSANYPHHRDLSSPEDFIYSESRKLSPIFDVHSCNEYNPIMNSENKDSNNISHILLRKTKNDRTMKTSCRSHRNQNSNQQNNSNIICNDAHKLMSKNKFGIASLNSEICIPNDGNFRHRTRNDSEKARCRVLSKIHPRKKTKYMVKYTAGTLNNYCHYMDSFNRDNKILNPRNRIDCMCQGAIIPVIPGNKKLNTTNVNDFDNHIDVKHFEPYEKSLQYLKKLIPQNVYELPQLSSKRNDKLDVPQSVIDIIKNFDQHFDDSFKNHITQNLTLTNDGANNGKLKIINKIPNESVSTQFQPPVDNSQERKPTNVVIIKCNENSKIKHPTIYKYLVLKNKLCDNESSDMIMKNIQSNEHNLCSTKPFAKKAIRHKYSEVEVDFNLT